MKSPYPAGTVGDMKSPDRHSGSSSSEPSGRGAGRAGEAGTAGGAAGAEPSNTAPANCNEGATRVLRTGVDTLVLSYPGVLSGSALARLAKLKELAQSEVQGERDYAQVHLAGQLLRVSPSGSGHFPFVLLSPWYRIAIRRKPDSPLPLAQVQVYSEPLTFQGVNKSVEALEAILGELGSIGPATLSRADLCSDFVTPHLLNGFPSRAWVSRARDIHQYEQDGQFSGWTLGLGGSVAARLYHKLLEMLRSGKGHLAGLYRECGWNGVEAIWRLEFEVKRDALRALGVRSVPDLMRALPELWAYLTRDWLRLTVPQEGDGTPSRWPLHPVWAVLQGADWGRDPLEGLSRAATDSAPSLDSVARTFLSALTSYMAIAGEDDPAVASQALSAELDHYLGRQEVSLSVPAADLVAGRVREKRRRFNTALNRRPGWQADPVLEAMADVYRKGRDGG